MATLPFDADAIRAEIDECETYLSRVQEVRDRALRLRGQLDVIEQMNTYTTGDGDSLTIDQENPA